jgi:hypothetical protein
MLAGGWIAFQMFYLSGSCSPSLVEQGLVHRREANIAEHSRIGETEV